MKKEKLKIELIKPKIFSGKEGESFKNFIVSFDTAYPDDVYEKQLKMMQLVSLLDGEAALWLKNLEYTAEDYDLARERLNSAYGEPTLQAFDIADKWEGLQEANSFKTLKLLYLNALGLMQKMRQHREQPDTTEKVKILQRKITHYWLKEVLAIYKVKQRHGDFRSRGSTTSDSSEIWNTTQLMECLGEFIKEREELDKLGDLDHPRRKVIRNKSFPKKKGTMLSKNTPVTNLNPLTNPKTSKLDPRISFLLRRVP